MTVGRSWGRRVVEALVLGPAVLLVTLVLPAGTARAHPLDVYLQSSYLTLSPTVITVELDLSPGVLVAPRILAALDGNADRQVSAQEATAYLERVLEDVEVRVDDRSLPLTLTRVEMPPYLTIQAGYGTMRVFADTPAGAPAASGAHRLSFRNGFSDDKAAYQVNAFVAKGAPVVLGAQQRDPTQRQATVLYEVTAADAAPVGSAPTRDATSPGAPGAQLAGYLQDPSLSAGLVLLALAAAALLGALHALTPGHAKTLMAAYLVGSGGTARNAVTLGAVVTVTHTASVIVIGLIALFASRFLLPGVLVPVLGGVAGLLVLGLGLRLLRQRWPRRRGLAPAESPRLVPSGAVVDHQHAHDDGDHEHDHRHGGSSHSHTLPAEGVTTRSVLAMGVSGGLVPCPEALGVMVIAVGVNRTGFGLGLILSFSAGVAAVLIGLGVLLVRSRTLLARVGRVPAAVTTVLPVISAAVVTVLGAGLVLGAIGSAGLL